MSTSTTLPVLSTPEHQHTPLDHEKNSIRLVKVLSQLSEDHLIQCTITQHILSEETLEENIDSSNHGRTVSQPYICLSYRWGDLQDQRFIRVNDRLVCVRKSLEQFLAVARITLPDTQLWIDALSIDQSDTVERNRQVQLMGRIFGEARAVLVWLGDDLEVENILRSINTKNGVQASASWHRDIRVINAASEYERLFRQRARDAFNSSEIVMASSSEAFNPFNDNTGKVEKIFEKLYENEYWSRAWVTQEIMLAQHVLVVAGYEIHPLLSLATIYRRAVLYFKDTAFESLIDLVLQQSRLRHLQSSGSNTGFEDWGVINLLHRFRNKKCAIRRDRIYSLLALSNEAKALKVDYSVPEEHLLLEVLNLRKSSVCLCSTAIVIHALAPWEFESIKDGVADAPFAELNLYACNLTSAVCPSCSNWVPFSWTRRKGALFCLAMICPDTPGHIFWEHSGSNNHSDTIDSARTEGKKSGSIYMQSRQNNKSRPLCEEGYGLSVLRSEWKNIYLLRFTLRTLIEVLEHDSMAGDLGLNACENLWPNASTKTNPDQARLRLCV